MMSRSRKVVSFLWLHFQFKLFGVCETLYAIWYHLYNFKNVKNSDGGVLLLVKLFLKDLKNSLPTLMAQITSINLPAP